MTASNPVTTTQLLLLAVIAVATIVGVLFIPAEAMLPVHWDVTGAPDKFWHRNYALSLMPTIAIATLIVNALAARMESAARGKFIVKAAVTALLMICGAVQSGIVMIGLGWDVKMMRIIALAVAVLLALVGNAMPKSRPNAMAGLRLPWTLRDPVIWQAAHRIAGKLMLQAAVLLAVFAVVLPAGVWLLVALLGCVLAPILAASIISYLLSRRPDVTAGEG